MIRLLSLVLLLTGALAWGIDPQHVLSKDEPTTKVKKDPRRRFYTGPYQPCGDDEPMAELKSLDAYSIRDFLVKIEDGIYVPARADDTKTFCASVLADDKGQPMGVVQHSLVTRDETGKRKEVATKVTGKILGRSDYHANMIYRAIVPADDARDRPVRWVRWPPCFARPSVDGMSRIFVQSGPQDDIEELHVNDTDVGVPSTTRNPHESEPPKKGCEACKLGDKKK